MSSKAKFYGRENWPLMPLLDLGYFSFSFSILPSYPSNTHFFVAINEFMNDKKSDVFEL